MNNDTLETRAITAALDPTFGNNGLVIIDDTVLEEALGITALADNKLLICATHRPHPYTYALIRLDPDGTFDPTFGDFANGIVFRHFKETLQSHAVSSTVLTNGMMLVAGVYAPQPGVYEAAITRLEADGRPDPEFGQNGVVYISIAPPETLPALARTTLPLSGSADPWQVRTSCTLTPLANGKILFSKTFIYPTLHDVPVYSVLGRLLHNGEYDTTFQNNGYVYIKPELENNADSHLIQADGSIVVAGHSSRSQTAYLVRYDTQGNIDPSFGKEGYVNFSEPLGRLGFVTALIAHSNDKLLLLANYVNDYPNLNGMAISCNADGSLDRAFNNGEPLFAQHPAEVNIQWRNAVEDGDGLVLVGNTDAIVLTRLLKTGVIDNRFGDNGWLRLQGTGKAENLDRQADGKIVIIGSSPSLRSVVARIMISPGRASINGDRRKSRFTWLRALFNRPRKA